jgi:hypothetical protein
LVSIIAIFIFIMGLSVAFSVGRMVGRLEVKAKSNLKTAQKREQGNQKPEEAEFVEIKE